MNIEAIIQPGTQFGQLIIGLIEASPIPREVIFVSAFANRQSLMRLRNSVVTIRRRGSSVRVIVGVDLDGTSEEALRELLSWRIDARVLKNRQPGHTFHPKIYLFERPDAAELLIGSNNLTTGGFYNNYETAVRISFRLPTDHDLYHQIRQQLQCYLDPQGATARRLSSELIEALARECIVRPERQQRAAQREAASRRIPVTRDGEPLFGIDAIPDPPPLPANLLAELIPIVKRERVISRGRTRSGRKVIVSSAVELTPISFHMSLNKLQGPNIPGEARIPMAARDLAEEFWGWPDNYSKESRTRGQKERAYWNWKPAWRISDIQRPDQTYVEEVRMYEYEDSQDFRFYSRRLVVLGADEGDIVRITRLADPSVVFECIFAKQGTPEHTAWSRYCTTPVPNSTRRYGYS